MRRIILRAARQTTMCTNFYDDMIAKEAIVLVGCGCLASEAVVVVYTQRMQVTAVGKTTRVPVACAASCESHAVW